MIKKDENPFFSMYLKCKVSCFKYRNMLKLIWWLVWKI